MILQNGQDKFTPDSNKVNEDVYCGVCGELMNVDREIMGATTPNEGRAGKEHLHDRFYCKNSNCDWHKQIKAIMYFQINIPTTAFDELLSNEIKQIKETKTPTKTNYGFEYHR